MKIDESGLHALVNKFIRNRVSTLEKKLPFEEAKIHEENAKQAAAADYEDANFNLLFKEELQEREVGRVLLEYGIKRWNEQQLVAEYIFSEMLDESLIDNQDILKLINAVKEILKNKTSKAGKK